MISSQDFERLSAYLDNQLSAKEKAVLEARLAREPELKATLNGLRQTVSALRTLPVVKPPRNFTLTAKQVGADPRRQWFPVLRMATSLAALALVVVFAGDFFVSRTPAASPAPVTAARSAAALPTEAPPASAMPAAAAPLLASTPMLDQSAAGTSAAGGEAAGGGATPTPLPEANTQMAAAVLAAPQVTTDTTGAHITEQPTVAAEAAPTGAPGSLPPAGTGAAGQGPAPAAPTNGLAATEAPAPTEPAPAAKAGAPLTPTETMTAPRAAAPLAPTESLAEAQPPATLTPSETLTSPAIEPYAVPAVGNITAPAQPPTPAAVLPWRALEFGLIGLTVVLAAVTWLLRRR
jgi:hypothetical protein